MQIALALRLAFCVHHGLNRSLETLEMLQKSFSTQIVISDTQYRCFQVLVFVRFCSFTQFRNNIVALTSRHCGNMLTRNRIFSRPTYNLLDFSFSFGSCTAFNLGVGYKV